MYFFFLNNPINKKNINFFSVILNRIEYNFPKKNIFFVLNKNFKHLKYKKKNYIIINTNNYILYNLAFICILIKKKILNEITLINIGESGYLKTFFCFFFCKLIKIKTVLIISGREDFLYKKKKINYFLNRIFNFIEKITLMIPDKVVCISVKLKRYIEKEFNIKVNYIPPGFNPLIFKYSDKSFKNIDFIFVGRLVEIKNIRFLYQVYKKIKKINPKYKFYIIGNGPYFKYLKKRIKENILIGELDYKKTIEYISRSKSLIITSKREGGPPNVLVEAFYLKTYVASTNVSDVFVGLNKLKFLTILKNKHLDKCINNLINNINNKNLKYMLKKNFHYIKNFHSKRYISAEYNKLLN